MSSSNLAQEWLSIEDEHISANDISEKLEPIADDQWVVAACVDRVFEDMSLQRNLLDVGIKRTNRASERAKEAYDHPATEDVDEEQLSELSSVDKRSAALVTHFNTHLEDARLCFLRVVLLERLDRLSAYAELCTHMIQNVDAEDAIDEEWEDDPWAAEGGDANTQSKQLPPAGYSISLVEFMLQDLVESAQYLASQCHIGALQYLMDRFGSQLWPYRFTILETIPEYIQPTEYHSILPSFDPSLNTEEQPSFKLVREQDWSEREMVKAALLESQVDLPQFSHVTSILYDSSSATHRPLAANELARWYERRVDAIIISTGMVDMSLSLVQHGASQGIPGLDQVGEELSLMSRLVYDATGSLEGAEDTSDWTLGRWRSLEPSSVVQAYLSRSSPSTLPRDIRTLVMPYLFVLEARAERSGASDAGLPQRMLYDYLMSAPLSLVASIFEASKPTLPAAQRLIRDDEDLTRLALACLYGSNSLDEWSTMSRIFECLPAWDIQGTDENERDEADATVTALGAFVTPSTTRPRCAASDLLIFFKPLPLTSLSRALDILDVHLESGETFARWNVPAPLRWFLQSMNDQGEQRKWANRMARRASALGERVDTEDQWEALLDDMLKLNNEGENGIKGALGLLDREEIIRVFFTGLLSAGGEW
jgi:neuroblastoma-amplified sequence